MEAFALLLLAVALWGHSWDVLRVTRARSTASLAAGVGIALLLAALFSPGGLSGGAAKTASATLVILWAFYALFVAGVGYTETDERALGLYALPLAAGSLILGWLVFAGGGGQAATLLAAGSIIAVIPFALLFIYAGLNAPALGRTYGYVQLIASVIIAVLAFAAFLTPGLTT